MTSLRVKIAEAIIFIGSSKRPNAASRTEIKIINSTSDAKALSPQVQAMKTRPKNKNLLPTNFFYLQIASLPGVPSALRRLVQAAYASHGGAEFMNLSDWRDLEMELKRSLENENRQPH